MKVKNYQGSKSSGAVRLTCKFYKKLDSIIMRQSSSVEPVSIASSSKSLPIENTDTYDDMMNIEVFEV